MSNTLYIDHVEVRYRKDGRLVHGLILFDDFECCNVLDFDEVSAVPTRIREIVELCRGEYHVNAIDLLERCAEEGHPAYLDGEPLDPAVLTTALAATRGD